MKQAEGILGVALDLGGAALQRCDTGLFYVGL